MIELDGSHLSLDDLEAAARRGARVGLAPGVREHMTATHEVVVEALERGDPVYGLTTAVAERKRVTVAAGDRATFNRQLIDGHLVAQGRGAPDDVVRAMLVCLANVLAKGAAGVRPELAELVLAALAREDLPTVRQLGSVGQADLGPNADLARHLLETSGFELAPGEALALLNHNSFAVSWGALALYDAERRLDDFDLAAALDFEAFGANPTVLHPVVAETRPFPGIATTSERMRAALAGSYLFEKDGPRNLQDPLTFRCVPQVHGAARDALAYGRHIVETELNSSQGNPVVVLSERRLVSVGNFDLGGTAAALDFARLAVAPVFTSASERTVKLLQQPFSGLPAGLASEAASSADALAELAVTSQSLAVEARTLVHPVSFELVSTTKAEGIEDRTTMAPLAARRVSEVIELAARILAIELVVAGQAVELRGSRTLGAKTGPLLRRLRGIVPFLGHGDVLAPDLEPVVELVRGGLSSAL